MIEPEICCSSALTPGGWITLARIRVHERGFIAEVSRLHKPGAAQPLSGPVVPGMPNLHSHAFQRQMAGRIEPGLRADLVELDMSHPLLEGRTQDSTVDTWLFAGGASMVRSVWAGGALRVDGGRYPKKKDFEGLFRQALREPR